MTSDNTVILGAGLAGLSAAYHLEEAGMRDWVILEREEKVGGLCRSLSYPGGFTFDHSIHILYSDDKYAGELIQRLLGENLIIQKRESWVYSSRTYTPYPWQANTHGLPADVVKDCLLGVIRATYEKNGDPPPTNFAEWCHATFGEGFSRHFMLPYNRKLWATDLENMTDAWIRDRVLTPKLADVIDGAIQRSEKDYGPNRVFWYPKTGGMESLPKGFLRYLDPEKIRLRTEVAEIDWQKRVVKTRDGQEFGYENLISSLPLPAVNRYLRPEPPEGARRAAGRLEHNTVYAINLAVRRPELLPYHWVYFPEEKYLLHRISFPKNFSPAMVPEGWSSITVELSAGSSGRQVPTGDALAERIIAELREAEIIGADDHVETKSVVKLNPAYVIFNHTHRDDVDCLHDFLRTNAIIPCGRFGEWEYFNMDHSILSGRKAALSTVAV